MTEDCRAHGISEKLSILHRVRNNPLCDATFKSLTPWAQARRSTQVFKDPYITGIVVWNIYYSQSFHLRHCPTYYNLLSAPLRSNGADYVLLLFIFIFYFLLFFYSPFVLRNYPTDSHQIFRNCVFWCSLNNAVVLKFFGRHLAEKNTKNSENLVKISRVDSDFWQ